MKTDARILVGLYPPPHHAACLLFACAAMNCSGARATTAAEEELARSPLPHEKLGKGGQQVQVRWVRYQGYVDGPHGHAALLEQLKADVHSCISAAQRVGRPTHPPQIWPDYVDSYQINEYEARNRKISYAIGLLYTVDQGDCSLAEHRQETAQLSSTLGFCQIDLLRREANGVCDADGHANAPLARQFGPRVPHENGQPPSLARQAVLAAETRAMREYGPVSTGAHKTISGIQCDVATIALGGGQTACIATVNSLKEPGANSNLTLELKTPATYHSAVKAQLGATVDGAVFSPYLVSGFQVANVVRHK